ncbi:GNAT family N-acetyltransferase [Roseospira visakhapatnamensis]|uniref:GNAT superfamily N-acetyltransferase n=1 Tax=Roseospira visakhapatnamensis TaxID=390880 RepID=A0A7W6W8D6_9PROT|nr:GNAT family N-acetyltransferase [Roseospira visakhapatnamensis]MBB4264708.1 GNAT superfamily N-acetyltransferase [Roseospira visakhapatnamensis]
MPLSLATPHPLPPRTRQPVTVRSEGATGRGAAFWTVTREGIHLRPMTARDAGAVRDFLQAQYDAFNAVDNTALGHATFRAFIAVAALRARLDAGQVIHLAERRGQVLGVCEIQSDGYLTLMYVRGDFQGRGLGRRLLQTALTRLIATRGALGCIRVRAMPYARRFYEQMGFRHLGEVLREDRGIRYYPFVLDLEPAAAPAPDHEAESRGPTAGPDHGRESPRNAEQAPSTR